MISGLVVGHSGYAQPPVSVMPALRAPPSRVPYKAVLCGSPALVPAACQRPATLQPRTLLARRPPRAHDGTDGGDLVSGEPTLLRALCT